MQVIFKPSYSHGVDWQCSLRQWEHDTEYDGVLKLKDPSAVDNKPLLTLPEDTERESNFSFLTTNRDYLSQVSMMASQKQSPRIQPSFHKRRQTYDQKFISEEDLPI
jgi:hypothetical protein